MALGVSSVRIYPVKDGNQQLKAFASVVFEEEFVVHNLRLVDTDSKVIVAMPNEEHQGDYRDVAHPITNDCRDRIRTAVIEAYNNHPDSRGTLDLEEANN